MALLYAPRKLAAAAQFDLSVLPVSNRQIADGVASLAGVPLPLRCFATGREPGALMQRLPDVLHCDDACSGRDDSQVSSCAACGVKHGGGPLHWLGGLLAGLLCLV